MRKFKQDEGFRIKKGEEREKIGIFNRMNVDKQQFLNYGPKFQEDIVKKRLANELKPEQIRNNIERVDKAYAMLLSANQQVAPTNYGEAFYVNEPMIARRGAKSDLAEMEEQRRRLRGENGEEKIIKPENQVKTRLQRGLRNHLAKNGIIDVSQHKVSSVSVFSA